DGRAFRAGGIACTQLGLARGEALFEDGLGLVETGPDRGFLVLGNILETGEHRLRLAVGADVCGAPGFERGGVRHGGKLSESGGFKVVDFVEHLGGRDVEVERTPGGTEDMSKVASGGLRIRKPGVGQAVTRYPPRAKEIDA